MMSVRGDCRADTAEEIVCGLVLVTGLPGSGKSSLLAALQAPWDDAPVEIRHVFQIDVFVAHAAAGTPGVFVPGQWKSAQAALHDAVEAALSTLHREADGPDRRAHRARAVPLVVVEDNMPLRSMREFYWRLCRRVEASDADAASGESVEVRGSPHRHHHVIAMQEMRLTVPLQLCLARNAERSAHEAVPRDVIETMAETFEDCLAPEKQGTSEPFVALDGPWQPLACAHPWPVLHVVAPWCPEPGTAREALAVAWPSVVHAQRESIRRYWSHTCTAAPPSSEASFRAAGHVFDQQLRATVRHFFSEYGAQMTPQTQKRVHVAKRVCLERRKALLAAHGSGEVPVSPEMEQQLALDFQHTLLSLIEPDRAPGGA